LMEALADLNEIKRGVLKGLGDIELLQICDVQRQFKQRAGYVLLRRPSTAAWQEC
jgi:hypothetical protein